MADLRSMINRNRKKKGQVMPIRNYMRPKKIKFTTIK